MNINATLFIQMVNFGVAWFLIRNLLVAPTIQVYMQQVTNFDALVSRYGALKKTIDAMRNKQYSLWHKWYLSSQKSIQEHYRPLRFKPVFSIQIPTSDISVDTMDELIRFLTNRVVTCFRELP